MNTLTIIVLIGIFGVIIASIIRRKSDNEIALPDKSLSDEELRFRIINEIENILRGNDERRWKNQCLWPIDFLLGLFLCTTLLFTSLSGYISVAVIESVPSTDFGLVD